MATARSGTCVLPPTVGPGRAAGQPDCLNCPFRGTSQQVPPYRSKTTKLVIVAERPGRTELQMGQPLVGDSGELLLRILDKWKIPRHHVHKTNAVLCYGKDNATPAEWEQAIACCKPRLEHEIRETNCSTILALGKRALQATTGKLGIFDWMGAPLDCGLDLGHPVRVLGALHPAHVLRPDGRAWLPVLYIHVLRAWRLANNELGTFRWPKIIIDPGADALRELKRIRRQKPAIGFDVETRGKDPRTASLMSLAISDAKTAISLPWEGYTAKGGEWVNPITSHSLGSAIVEEVRAIIEDASIEKVLQNGQHDIISCERLGWTLRGYTFDCLLAHAVVIQGVKHDLGTIAAIEFPADRWKSEFHATGDSKGLESFVRRDPRVLRTYNAKDAAMTLALRAPLERRLDEANNGRAIFAGYMERALIALEMRRRGAAVDNDRRLKARRKLRWNRNRAKHELRELTAALGMPDFNPRRWQDCNKLFFEKLKVVPSSFSEKTGRPKLDEKVLTKLVVHPNRIIAACSRSMLRYRRWAKMLSTYIERMPIDERSIVHPTWNVSGARTQRWSCIASGTPVDILRDVHLHPAGIPIEHVQAGDMAYSFSEDGALRLHRVVRRRQTGFRKVIRVHWISTHRGRAGYVDMTPDHHLRLTSGKWKRADCLLQGDSISSLARGIDKEGYCRLYPSGLPMISREHRFVTGAQPHLSVHHKDGNPANNRIENLHVCSHAEHMGQHPASESRRESARQHLAARRAAGWRRKVNHYALGLTRDDCLKLLQECNYSVTRVAREKHIDFNTFKKYLRLHEFDLSELKRMNGGRWRRHNNHRITRVEILPGYRRVYDLEIEGTHNFIAGELCVHNSQDPNVMNIPKPVTRKTKAGRTKVVRPGLRDLFVGMTKRQWVKMDAGLGVRP